MSKSRSGKTPSSNQNAAPGPTQNAIIPGKFMESDWYDLLEVEEDENFIADIIDEITKCALDQVADKIVKSRILPHTVLAARELLLDVIQWQFLQSDRGEVGTSEKLSWIEDQEPCTSVIDNWAQGAVPVDPTTTIPPPDTTTTTLLHSPLINGEEEKSNAGEDMFSVQSGVSSVQGTADGLSSADVSFARLCIEENVDDDEGVDDGVQGTFNMLHDDDDDDGGDVVDDIQDLSVEIKRLSLSDRSCEDSGRSLYNVTSSKTSQRKKKSTKYRPHVGQLPVFEKIPLDSVTDLRPKPGTSSVDYMCGGVGDEFVVRNQYGRASGPKEVIYDERGKVVKVEKLNVNNFPTHRVPVKYSVIEGSIPDINMKGRHLTSTTTTTTTMMKKKNKKQQPEQHVDMSTTRINAKTFLQRMHQSNTRTTSLSYLDNNNNSTMRVFKPLEPRSPLPPLMVDSMNVSDGVTIREGGLSKQVVRKTPLEPTSSESIRQMFPISDTSAPLLNVKDIVDKTSYRYITAS